MKIGIVGSGEVGQALAKGFLKYGYEVKIGTNNRVKAAELQSKVGAPATVGSFDEVARFGELIVLAVKGAAAEAALKGIDSALLKGKTVILRDHLVLKAKAA